MTARRWIYLVRHGETDWNAAQRWQGQTDIPLNALGRRQARAVAEALRGLALAGVVASDLSRAEETARIVADQLGMSLAYSDTELRERSFGCFEGLTREDCERLHPEAWREWLARRTPPTGAETHEALTLRMVAAVDRVAARVARPDAGALVVTHGGSLRALVAAATGELPPPVANGAIWRVTWDGGPVAADAWSGGDSLTPPARPAR